MKYKLYERLTDFFRSSLFSKTNIAVVAVMSIILNIALAGVAYSSHKDLEMFMSLYAPTKSEETTTVAAVKAYGESTTAVPQTSEAATQKNTETAVTQEPQQEEKTTSLTAESEEDNQGTYYVTSSGTKYHKSTCSYLSKSRISISLSDAKSKGYTPCSRCIG